MRIDARPLRVLGVFLLLLQFTTLALAQSVQSVEPTAGSIQIPITITGTGFGANKAKVTFENATLKKKINLTIKTWSDTVIVGALPSGAAGVYDVKIAPKGAAVIASPAAFEIQTPEISELFTAVEGATVAGEIITITGGNFGGKKGTVKFDKTTAKVISWSDAAVAVTVPKVKDGVYNVILANSIGNDTTSLLVGAPNTGTITGTAAKGGAIASANITVVDKKGATKTGQSNGAGAININVSGLVLPFLIQLDVPGGGTLFSVAEQTGVINIDPVTDVIVKTWYFAQGTTAAAAFADIQAHPMPSSAQLATIKNFVADILHIWLVGEGLDPASFDLISTPFSPSGAGFDAVLDELAIQENGAQLTLQLQDTPVSPTLTATAIITFDAVVNTATSDVSTAGPGGTSGSSNTIYLSNDPLALKAIAGINTSLAQFQSIINLKGAALKSSDLLSSAATGFLNEGMGASDAFASLVTDLRGLTMQSARVTRILSLDSTGVAEVEFQIVISNGSESQTEKVKFFFKKVGNAWKWLGDQKLAEVGVTFEFNTDLPGFQPHFATPYNRINVDVRAPKGSVASVTVTGGGLFNNTNVPKDSLTAILNFEPVPGTIVPFEQDVYFISADPAQALPAGTPITVTVTPVSGTPASYIYYAQGSTSEATNITAPTGHNLSDAKLGQNLQMTWTLPQTFPIAEIKASAHIFTQNFQCEIDAIAGVLTPTTTSATFAMPTTCNGEAIVGVNLNLSFDGVNGERIQFLYNFQ